MLKISEFSALTGISIHMLRHYDTLGLLKPERVDGASRYRYYGETQLVRANSIQILKGLGFALREIAEVLSEGAQSTGVSAFLRDKIREKEIQRSGIERQIAQMRQALAELDFNNEYTLSVGIKTIPARQLVGLRGLIREFSEEGLLWARLNGICAARKIRLADIPYCMAVTHSADLQKHVLDTEVFRFVEQIGPDIAGLTFSRMPETKAAVVAFQGDYSRIAEIQTYLYRWIAENGYEISAKPFSVYYISPGNDASPQNFITEYCCPVR